MAKKVQTSKLGKFHGKTFAFLGKFGYKDMYRTIYERQIRGQGGQAVDPANIALDYLVVGEGRGGKPPAEVAKIQKKAPQVQVLDVAAFLQLIVPDPDVLIQKLRSGRCNHGDRFWEELDQILRQGQSTIDLRQQNLAKYDLFAAYLESVKLSGSDLSGANTQYTHFGDLEDVNFTEANSRNVYLRNLKNCQFHRTDLESVWMFWADAKKVENCDFREASMKAARMERGTFTDCQFEGCDLSDGKLEKSVFVRVDFSKTNMSRVHGAESTFDGANFSLADLHRADFRNASFVGANLSNANLREAVLSDADLTGANVAGADFQDAVLTGTKLDQVDLSSAKNIQLPNIRQAGPKLTEFAAAVVGSKSFLTSVEVDLGKDEFAILRLDNRYRSLDAVSRYHHAGNDAFDRLPAPSTEQGILNLANRWPKATLRLDSVVAQGGKTVRGQKLTQLAMEAWSEAFGISPPSSETLELEKKKQQADALRERDKLMEKVRKKGAKNWNKLDYRVRNRIDLKGVDLSGGLLDELSMSSCELAGASFASASMKSAELWGAQCQNADFSGANLEKARLQGANFIGAKFPNANLTNANLEGCKLQGADLTGAILKDTNFEKAQFDHATLFPAKFTPPTEMIWKGDGFRPGAKAKVVKGKAGSLKFEDFLEHLAKTIEASRLSKASSMLKAERFNLFADVQDDSLVGIVKSQSSKELVYSCKLDATGAFGCCTQNLRPCGGLRGALCKHLLVLIIGLAKAGKLDSATVDNWVNLSGGKKPAIDEDAMSATFLRYKGAEAGEVDWRPTETIPEDFYAM